MLTASGARFCRARTSSPAASTATSAPIAPITGCYFAYGDSAYGRGEPLIPELRRAHRQRDRDADYARRDREVGEVHERTGNGDEVAHGAEAHAIEGVADRAAGDKRGHHDRDAEADREHLGDYEERAEHERGADDKRERGAPDDAERVVGVAGHEPVGRAVHRDELRDLVGRDHGGGDEESGCAVGGKRSHDLPSDRPALRIRRGPAEARTVGERRRERKPQRPEKWAKKPVSG